MDRVIETEDTPLAAADPPRERPLSRVALAVAVGIVVWDFLFYDAIGGFTHGIFTLVCLGLLVWVHPEALALRLPRILAVALGGIAVAQCIEPSLLASTLAIAGLASFGLVARAERAPAGAEWLRSWYEMVTGGWLQLVRDLGQLRAELAERGGWRGRLARVCGDWLPPFVLSLPFVGLFAMANPLIELRLEGLGEAIANFFRALHPVRLLAWSVVGAAGWALLRFRTRPEAPAVPAAFDARREALQGRMLVRCLGVFNALFAVQTLLDLGYFWSGFSLPEGMTYAAYAHRGAYPLVATTLLAILFILATFGDDLDLESPQRRRAVHLVYLWLAQNAFLLASAAARLELYVDVYELTRLRVAAAIWLGLVAAGLAFTLVKIATRRSNAWLVNANLATTASVLWLCCFPDFGGFIAEHNVDRALAENTHVDVYYLRQLGPAAQPALRRWWDSSAERADWERVVTCSDRRLRHQLDDQLRNWRGYSLRRAALRARHDPEWHERLPACERPC